MKLNNLLAGISKVAQYDSTAQKQCCDSSGNTIALDLAGDGNNGLVTSMMGCEKACRVFTGCKYFMINPEALFDQCTGYPSCEFLCSASLGSPRTIYKRGPTSGLKHSQNLCCESIIQYEHRPRIGDVAVF